MANLLTNQPPEYNPRATLQENFAEFFHWALSLNDPLNQIPEIGAELGFAPARLHPIGFTAVYLTRSNRGWINSADNPDVVRADIFPPGITPEPHVHCHGFDHISGTVAGELLNKKHNINWNVQASVGEGYTGYESRVDEFGRNQVVKATTASIVVPEPEVEVVGVGETYTMRPRIDFHSVDADGAVTIFAKTATYVGQAGLALVLKPPGHTPPPEVY